MKNSISIFFACASSALAANAIDLFNGKDLQKWESKPGVGTNLWVVGEPSVSKGVPRQLNVSGTSGAMVNMTDRIGNSLDIYSKEKFGSCLIELDLMLSAGSNSGIYLMGEYEVQVFDSFRKPDGEMAPIDMGAIYGTAVPKLNASKAPGEWQHYVIEWQAPKFDAQGNKTANARFVKVELNGKPIHENLEINGPTPAGLTGKEHPEGPLMLQGNHGPVSYKNIRVTPR